MRIEVNRQEFYSRGELILRTLFAPLYIGIPHGFILFFLSLWSSLLTFISFWSIMFTGRYPESFFEYQEKFYRWNFRVNARFWDLCDGYPDFGLDVVDNHIDYKLDYPESIDRVSVLLRFLFGFFYVLIPHGIALFFRGIASFFVGFIAFWIILFTGEFPKSMFEFQLGTLRWSDRVNLYMAFLIHEYPPFSGR